MSHSSRRRTVILSLLGAAFFAGQWNLIFLAPLLPTVANDIDVSVSLAGQLVTVSGLAAIVFLVLLGPLSDRYGRRPLLLIGLAAMAIAALGSYFTSSYALLMALRILSGVGDALVLPSAAAAVADYFKGKDREVALNMLLMAGGGAAVAGLPLAVVVTDVWDWHAAFLLFAVFNLVVLLAIGAALPGAPAAKPARQDLAAHYRESYREVFGQRAVLVVLAASVLGATLGSGVFIYAGAFFDAELGIKGAALSGLFAAFGGCYVAGGVMGAVLARRMQPRPIALGSAVAAALLLLPLVTSTEIMALTVGLALVFSATRAPGIAALNNMLLDLVPRAQGTALSVSGVVAASGYFIGAAAGGIAIALGGYIGMGTLFTICAIGAAVLLALPALLSGRGRSVSTKRFERFARLGGS